MVEAEAEVANYPARPFGVRTVLCGLLKMKKSKGRAARRVGICVLSISYW